MKPKCTIFGGWTGPECGKDAISMNDYGGFQCEFHDSIPPCKDNDPGSFKPIAKDHPDAGLMLQEAYDRYLKTEQQKSGRVGSQVVIAAHNVPNNMLRSKGKK